MLCKLQLSGPHINVERIKEFMNAKTRNSKDIAIRNRILDKCVDQGKYRLKEMKLR